MSDEHDEYGGWYSGKEKEKKRVSTKGYPKGSPFWGEIYEPLENLPKDSGNHCWFFHRWLYFSGNAIMELKVCEICGKRGVDYAD